MSLKYEPSSEPLHGGTLDYDVCASPLSLPRTRLPRQQVEGRLPLSVVETETSRSSDDSPHADFFEERGTEETQSTPSTRHATVWGMTGAERLQP